MAVASLRQPFNIFFETFSSSLGKDVKNERKSHNAYGPL